jgi:hypothetical protein
MVACNQDKLMVLGFGGEYVDIYQSNSPVHKISDFNAKLWTSPVFVSFPFIWCMAVGCGESSGATGIKFDGDRLLII